MTTGVPLARKREQGRIRAIALTVPVVFAIMLGGGWFLDQRQQERVRQNRQAMESIRQSMAAAYTISNTSIAHPVDPGGGDAGRVAAAIRDLVNLALSDRRDYMNELKAAHFNEILTPAALQADPSLVRSRARAAQIVQVVKKYRARAMTRIPEIRGKLLATAGAPAIKAGMIQQMDQSMQTVQPVIDQTWDDEALAADTMRSLVDYLARHRNGWRVYSGRIIFDDAKDLKAFNDGVIKIQSAGRQSQALRDQYFQIVNQSIDNAASAAGLKWAGRADR